MFFVNNSKRFLLSNEFDYLFVCPNVSIQCFYLIHQCQLFLSLSFIHSLLSCFTLICIFFSLSLSFFLSFQFSCCFLLMQTHVSAHNVRKNTCLGYFKPINAMLDTNKHTRPLFESISLSIHHLNFIQVRKKSRIVLGFTLVNHKICHERKWCKVSEDE